MPNLQPYGWNSETEAALHNLDATPYQPARVVAEYGLNYKLVAPEEIIGEITGKLRHELTPTEQPKVGDWVLIQPTTTDHTTIHGVLPRQSEISRLLTDRTRAQSQPKRQVLAVNVDLALLVQALDQDFSPARLERYLFQLAKDHIRSLVVINKIDKATPTDIESAVNRLKELGIPVITTSAHTDTGLDTLRHSIASGETAVLLGSSGVGKSTLTNLLLGQDRQATREVRASDSKGRHTTSHRELFILPEGGLLIDTPGLRELQLWGAEEQLEQVFPDIDALALECQFSDCLHQAEPNCAVQAAVVSGKLSPGRLESYQSFQRELRHLAAAADTKLQLERKQAQKQAQKQFNQIIRDEKTEL